MLAHIYTSHHMVARSPPPTMATVEQMQQVFGEAVATLGQTLVLVLQQHSVRQEQQRQHQQRVGTPARKAQTEFSQREAAAQRQRLREHRRVRWRTEGQGTQKIFEDNDELGRGANEGARKPAESCIACWPGTLGQQPRRSSRA